MTVKVLAQGGKAVEAALEKHHQGRVKQYRTATGASAKVFQRAIQAELPRRKGTLRRHVKVYQIGEHSQKVKITGQVAHLIIEDVREHAIQPKGMDAAQTHARQRGGRMQGPMLAKRALSYRGADHPFARAIVPAHRGDPSIVPRARDAASAEATAVAHRELAR